MWSVFVFLLKELFNLFKYINSDAVSMFRETDQNCDTPKLPKMYETFG